MAKKKIKAIETRLTKRRMKKSETWGVEPNQHHERKTELKLERKRQSIDHTSQNNIMES